MMSARARRISAFVLNCIAVVGMFCGSQAAVGQPYYALEYYGGPVLDKFTVYPLYFGNSTGPGAWTSGQIATEQAYLGNLVKYISGVNAPAGQQPMLRQYGVIEAKLHDAIEVTPPATPASPCYSSTSSAYPTSLLHADILCIISENQSAGKLPPYGPHTLIALFLAPGFYADPCSLAGCHQSESIPNYWLAVPLVATGPKGTVTASDIFGFQVTSAHEVFESATDPAVNGRPTCSSPPCGPAGPTTWGWLSDQYLHTSASPPYVDADEAIDECGNSSFITLTNLGGISIPSAIDNSLGTYIPSSPGAAVGGTCSTTGYSSNDQHAVYGVTLAQFTSAYSIAKSQGMRLYILQTYVTKPKGDILYNAVWQPAGNTDELEDYGVSYSQLQTDDLVNSSKSYRLYILQSYVLPPSAGPLADMVRYNAVWRPGLFNYETDYGVTLSQYQSDYGARFAAQQRLYSLQAYVQNAIFVFYNALWRLGITAEKPHYGLTDAQLASTNSTLSSLGWRLYLLQSYAVGTDPQLYDAVWRPGHQDQVMIHDATFAAYQSESNTLEPQGYRLYILDTVVLASGDVRYTAVWQKGSVDRPL